MSHGGSSRLQKLLRLIEGMAFAIALSSHPKVTLLALSLFFNHLED